MNTSDHFGLDFSSTCTSHSVLSSNLITLYHRDILGPLSLWYILSSFIAPMLNSYGPRKISMALGLAQNLPIIYAFVFNKSPGRGLWTAGSSAWRAGYCALPRTTVS